MITNVATDPDCISGKHSNCDGTGWDISKDEPAPCPCHCHERSAA